MLREPNTKLIKVENQAWSQINWIWKDKIEEQRNLKWQEKKKLALLNCSQSMKTVF